MDITSVNVAGRVVFVDYELSGYHGPATADLSLILDLSSVNRDIITRYIRKYSHIWLPFCLSVCLSVCMSVFQPACLPV